MAMNSPNRRPRMRFGRIAAEFTVIFIGVTAAFFVESYREDREQREQLLDAIDGIKTELSTYGPRGLMHADSIDAALARWRAADETGERTVPAFYRIPGSRRPPRNCASSPSEPWS